MKRKHENVALFVPHAGCPHQCSFCNQRHISGTTTPLTRTDVQNACTRALETSHVDPACREIAFFGGSFTAISRTQMLDLLEAAYPFVQNGSFSGIRVSTRPDAIDREILSILCRYGVSTVELGAQSMTDAVLAENRRGHTAQDVCEASKLIKEYGLTLGLQMMTGLPGDTDDGALYTARELAALSPDFVRIYPTLVVEHTPLADRYRTGAYTPQTTEQAIELCAKLLSFFEEENRIPVIRLGLHADTDMQDHCLAGPFHPAFRERCESRLLLQKMQRFFPVPCKGTVTVHPSMTSKVIGQKRENVRLLTESGRNITIVTDDTLLKTEIRMEVIE